MDLFGAGAALHRSATLFLISSALNGDRRGEDYDERCRSSREREE